MVDTDLRARLDAMRAEMDALEHALSSDSAPPLTPRPRRRRMRLIGGVLLAIVAVAVPVGVFASHQFTDVPTSNTFHGSIDKIKTAGITAGCTATKYCPNDPVTRGQMAAFLTRAATRGGSFSDSNIEINDERLHRHRLGHDQDPGRRVHLPQRRRHGLYHRHQRLPVRRGHRHRDRWRLRRQLLLRPVPGQPPGAEQRAYAALSNGWVIPVDSARGRTRSTVHMYLDYGTAEVLADATMNLLWVPFDENGNAWEPPVLTSAGQPRNR